MSGKLKILFVVAFLLMTTSAARAAVIYLNDGSEIHGTVVSATARDIQVHTPDGTLTIAADRISRIDYNESQTPAQHPASESQPPAATPVEPQPYRRSMRDYQSVESIEAPSRQLIYLGFGVAAPTSRVNFSSTGGGSDDNGHGGLLLGAQYLYSLDPRWSTGVNVEYFNRSDTGSQSLLPDATTDVSGDSLLFLATLKYSPLTHTSARPYILGGIGTNRTTTSIDATPNPGFAWSDSNTGETRTLVDDTHWGFASTVRLGVDFNLMDPAVFSLELGWTGISNSQYPATSAGQDVGLDHVTGNLSALTIAGRWGWRF